MEFLAESYLDIPSAQAAARLAAAAERVAIRHLRTIAVPGDETLLAVFDAPSPEAVRHAYEVAGLSCDRISRAESA
ncbi:MAG: nickel-binding protein [Actinomycetota bacterium]